MRNDISLYLHILSMHGHHLSPLLQISNQREVLPGTAKSRRAISAGFFFLRFLDFLHFLVEESQRMAAMQWLINGAASIRPVTIAFDSYFRRYSRAKISKSMEISRPSAAIG